MLDDLINQLFDFHVVVPIAEFETVLKVKPSFNKLSRPLPGTSLNRASSKGPENTQTQYKGLNWNSPDKWRTKLSRAEIEVKPEINATLKLEVAKAPMLIWRHVQEVAEALEEIL